MLKCADLYGLYGYIIIYYLEILEQMLEGDLPFRLDLVHSRNKRIYSGLPIISCMLEMTMQIYFYFLFLFQN